MGGGAQGSPTYGINVQEGNPAQKGSRTQQGAEAQTQVGGREGCLRPSVDRNSSDHGQAGRDSGREGLTTNLASLVSFINLKSDRYCVFLRSPKLAYAWNRRTRVSSRLCKTHMRARKHTHAHAGTTLVQARLQANEMTQRTGDHRHTRCGYRCRRANTRVHRSKEVGTLQHPARHDTTQHDTTRHNTTQHNTTRVEM